MNHHEENMNKLHRYVESGDIKSLKEELERKPENITTTNENGDSLLHVSVWHGKYEISKFLLESGLNPGLKNKENRTPMHNAFETGNSRIHELLIEYGVEVDICIAAARADLNRIKELLDKDPSLVNDDSTGLTPMDWAGYGNSSEAIDLLVKYGADVNYRHKMGEFTALMFPVKTNGTKAVSALLMHGADPNLSDHKGWTSLHHAATMTYTKDNSDVVRLLLENGADPNLKNNKDKTPIGMVDFFRKQENPDHLSVPNHDTKQWDKVIAVLRDFGGK